MANTWQVLTDAQCAKNTTTAVAVMSVTGSFKLSFIRFNLKWKLTYKTVALENDATITTKARNNRTISVLSTSSSKVKEGDTKAESLRLETTTQTRKIAYESRAARENTVKHMSLVLRNSRGCVWLTFWWKPKYGHPMSKENWITAWAAQIVIMRTRGI